MLSTTAIRIYRLVLGLLTLAAVFTQMMHGIHAGGFNAVNFFSFFTIESNLLAAAMFIVGAFLLAPKTSERFEIIRGAAVVYMTTTGLVYSLLLSGLADEVQTPIPWINFVLHYAMPVLVLADWFIAPPRKAVSLQKSLWWLAFPLLYVAYSLIRGPIVHWYPYPFLNPGSDHNYLRVTVYSVGIAVTIFALCWLVRLPSGRRRATR